MGKSKDRDNTRSLQLLNRKNKLKEEESQLEHTSGIQDELESVKKIAMRRRCRMKREGQAEEILGISGEDAQESERNGSRLCEFFIDRGKGRGGFDFRVL